MKKIFLYRLIAILLMCLPALLIKSENVACKARCTAYCGCELQQQKIMSEKHANIFYDGDGLFIKI